MATEFVHLHSSRSHHCAVVLDDDRVLISGGMSAQGEVLGTAEILNPQAEGWTIESTSLVHVPRLQHSCVSLSSGRVLVIGGVSSNGKPVGPIDVFDPITKLFAVPLSIEIPRAHHIAVLLSDDLIVVVGGEDREGNILKEAELMDVAKLKVTKLPSAMNYPRSFHRAKRLLDGSVLVSGGIGHAKSSTTAEVFNPVDNSFSPPIEMGTARVLHTATLLRDGRVLTFSNGLGELYSRERHEFKPVPGLSGPAVRDGHTATLLHNGKVLIVGGGVPEDDEDLLGAPLLFDPVTDSFQVVQSTNELVNRADHAAVSLPDGTVLITGGRTLDAVATDDVVIFDPKDSTFNRVPLAPEDQP